MKGNVIAILGSIAIVAGMGMGPASAGGLLGGVTDTLGGTVDSVVDTVTDTVDTVVGGDTGGTNVANLVSVNDDNNDALVNLDVGDTNTNNNNILNAAVGNGNNPLVNANVSSTGLLKSTSVSLDVAGLGLDVDLDLDLIDPNNPNSPNNPNNPNSPGGRILVGSLGNGDTFVINCAVNNTRQLLQVAAAGKITAAEIRAWQRAANVQIIPIKLCPAAKKQVAQILARSQKVNLLRRAVMGDNLIMASLGRTRYDAGDVVAVQRKAGQLVVYVY